MTKRALGSTGTLSMWLIFCMASHWALGAADDDWQWMNDMPGVADVEAAIQGENLEQTLGWQCAVYTNLLLGKHLPASYAFAPPAQAQALVTELKTSYRGAIASVRERYSQNVRSLADPENARQFDLICGADGRRVDNTGRRFGPAVPDVALARMFKPSVLAVYQQQLESSQAQQAAYDARMAQAEQDQEDMIRFGVLWLGGMALSMLAGVWCLVKAFRVSRSLQLSIMGRTNSAGVQEFGSVAEFDAVQLSEGVRKVQLKVLVTLGGFLLILGPFVVGMLMMLE